MKTCYDCKLEKPSSDFNKHKDRTDGLCSFCKLCSKIRWQNRYTSKEFRETRKKTSREFYDENKEKIKKRTNAYYHENKEALAPKKLAYQKKKMENDPKFRLSRRLRNRLYYALSFKTWKKTTKFSEYIGCSLEELKLHLQNQFKDGMSWENMGEWHVDHIIPLVSAQTEEEMYRLCHFSNLSPMWAKENLSKGSKI